MPKQIKIPKFLACSCGPGGGEPNLARGSLARLHTFRNIVNVLQTNLGRGKRSEGLQREDLRDTLEVSKRALNFIGESRDLIRVLHFKEAVTSSALKEDVENLS